MVLSGNPKLDKLPNRKQGVWLSEDVFAGHARPLVSKAKAAKAFGAVEAMD